LPRRGRPRSEVNACTDENNGERAGGPSPLSSLWGSATTDRGPPPRQHLTYAPHVGGSGNRQRYPGRREEGRPWNWKCVVTPPAWLKRQPWLREMPKIGDTLYFCDNTPRDIGARSVRTSVLREKGGGSHVRYANRVLDVRTGDRSACATRLAEMPQVHAEARPSFRRDIDKTSRAIAKTERRRPHNAAGPLRCLSEEVQRAADVGHWTALRSAIAARTTSSTPGSPRFCAALAVGANHSALRESRRRACLAAPGVMPTSRANAAGPPNRSMTWENE